LEKRYLTALKKNSDRLIDEWTLLVKNSSKNYSSISEEEARARITDHFWALIDIYEYGNFDKLNAFLTKLAKIRSTMEFDLKETQIAFLNGQSVLLRFLDQLRGKQLQFCSNCRDITESFNKTQSLYSQIFQNYNLEKKVRNYREEIREKELRLSSLTEGTADAVIIMDDQLHITSWNRGAEEMYLYKTAEILGKHLSLLVPETNLKDHEIDKLVEIVYKQGYLKNYQTQRVRKDGKILTVDITTTLLTDNGKSIRGYSSIHRDLTEKIQLEQEIRSQEQYLSTIVDNSVDAIIGLDLNSTIVSWNKGAEYIFGYTKSEMIGKNLDILLPKEAVKSGELDYLNDQINKKGFIKNHESLRVTKSGRHIITSLTRSVIRDKNGKIIGSSAILRDITEYKKLKMQMSHSEKLAVVGQLTAGIAHEVGNPLTSISSLIQVLSRTVKEADLHDKLLLIKKQTDRITKLIRELVTIAQPTDFIIKRVDINSLINEAISIIRYDKRARNCTFNTRLSKKIPILELPEDQVLQVFINILFNAVDAIPEENGLISVRSSSKNGTIYAQFQDNGSGIPAAVIDKIFDPFFTTKSVGKGTGLGLWVSYGIIESVNGKIRVTSRENEGSTFIVEIPVMR